MKKSTITEYWDILKYFLLATFLIMFIKDWITRGLSSAASFAGIEVVLFCVIYTVVSIIKKSVKYHQNINREKEESNCKADLTDRR